MFYDTHAHLDGPDFLKEMVEIIDRARKAGIVKIISIGTNFVSSQESIRLAERFEEVYAVAGWHPCEALEAPEDIRTELRQMAGHPKVVALGETGLDFYRLPSASGGTERDDSNYKEKQAELYRQHLEVAVETGLNCVIHQRAAVEETLGQMKAFSDRTAGVFHCFAESKDILERILSMGSIVSFTGIVTFKNGGNIRETLKSAPAGSFMLETDSPYLAPVPHRGKRNEPAFVREIAEMASTVKGCSLNQLSEETCATAHRFFKKLSD